MAKIDNETAVNDLNRFITALRVTDVKLEKLAEEKESVIKLIESGHISVSDENSVTYQLIEKIEDDNKSTILDSVTFKPRRVRVDDIEKRMTGKNDIEKTRNMFAFLTGVNSGLFSKLDGDDFINISSIAAFFLPR